MYVNINLTFFGVTLQYIENYFLLKRVQYTALRNK
jgi:hypothetical protein